MTATVVRLCDGRYQLCFPFDRWVVDSLKAEIPPDCRGWNPDARAWWINPNWCGVAVRILRSAFDHVDVTGEAWQRAAEPPPNTALAAFHDLHLLPSAPPEIVTIVYRELAKLHHPDRGGDIVRMQRINAAFDSLRERGLVAGGMR
jgi:hypothetical protein